MNHSNSKAKGSTIKQIVNQAKDSAIKAIVHQPSYTNSTITSLQDHAIELAGLTYDRAFAIDTVNIGIDVGEYTITKLMETFFELVYNDPDEWFSNLFKRVPKADMIQNLSDYIVQRAGGPPYYSASKNSTFPAIILRHNHFNITTREAERWLNHFEDSLDLIDKESEDCIKIQESFRNILSDHMRYVCYYLVAAKIKQYNDGCQGIQFL